jgi:hypothetical protein
MTTGTENPVASASTAVPQASSSKVVESAPPAVDLAPLRIIFVCRGDIDPVDLIEPLLLYVTSWNALVRNCRSRLQTKMREVKAQQKENGKDDDAEGTKAFWEAAVKALVKTEEVYLVPLPQGAEMELAGAVGLRRVAVMALTVCQVVKLHCRSFLANLHFSTADHLSPC